jgi:hypothetical protein
MRVQAAVLAADVHQMLEGCRLGDDMEACPRCARAIGGVWLSQLTISSAPFDTR